MSVRERMMSPAIWIDDPTEANHCKTRSAGAVAGAFRRDTYGVLQAINEICSCRPRDDVGEHGARH